MKIDLNIFRWIRFLVEAFKIFTKIFGDEEAKGELKKNGINTEK